MQRLLFLDSFRAIAITSVALFHYFHLWGSAQPSSPYPYGGSFAHVPLFAYGDYGVQLFFLVSGFAIALTLENCGSFREFLLRRFARLFPALLFCTALVFIVRQLAGSPAFPPARLVDLLPSLTTVGPTFFKGLSTPMPDYVIGSVWTLFVEIRFYLIAAAIYFFVSSTRLAEVLLALAVLAMAGALAAGTLDSSVGKVLTTVLLAKHIGWLALGAYGYRVFNRRQTPGETALAVTAWVSLVALDWTYPHVAGTPAGCALVAAVMPAVFYGFCRVDALQRLLAIRGLAYVGVVSYSFYLVHEVLGVTLLSHVSAALPLALQLAAVAVVFAAMVGIAALIYHGVEVPGRGWLRAPFARFSTARPAGSRH